MKTSIVTIKKSAAEDGFIIYGDAGVFEMPNGKPRKFKSQTGAILFLQSLCKKYPDDLKYSVTLPSGEIRQIGETEPKPETERRPHEWSKKNMVTIVRGGSSYDIYRCRFCGKEEKAYGLNGHARKSGDCPKAPVPAPAETTLP